MSQDSSKEEKWTPKIRTERVFGLREGRFAATSLDLEIAVAFHIVIVTSIIRLNFLIW